MAVFQVFVIHIHTYTYPLLSSYDIVLLTGLIKVVLTFDSSLNKFALAREARC